MSGDFSAYYRKLADLARKGVSSDTHARACEAEAVQLLRGLGYRVFLPTHQINVAVMSEQYAAGASAFDIAIGLGVSDSWVKETLKKAGLSLRRAGRPKGAKGRKDGQPYRTKARLAAMEGATP